MTFRKFSGEEGESWWEGGHVTPEYFCRPPVCVPTRPCVRPRVTLTGAGLDPDPARYDSARTRTGQFFFCVFHLKTIHKCRWAESGSGPIKREETGEGNVITLDMHPFMDAFFVYSVFLGCEFSSSVWRGSMISCGILTFTKTPCVAIAAAGIAAAGAVAVAAAAAAFVMPK